MRAFEVNGSILEQRSKEGSSVNRRVQEDRALIESIDPRIDSMDFSMKSIISEHFSVKAFSMNKSCIQMILS